MTIPRLQAGNVEFPPLNTALDDPNGLLAAGGDLSPARLLAAYRQGIFPWYEQGQPILWWSPNPRTVIYPEQLHVSRSLRKTLRRQLFRETLEKAFDQVIAACAAPRSYANGTWITPEMIRSYRELHQLGHAHSVEVWRGEQLVGGLYGIALGRVFFGESMFSWAKDASKVGFAHLARQLSLWQFQLIDCQVANDHLFTLGAMEIPRDVFQRTLLDFTCLPSIPAPWQFTSELVW
jgi:leucyl/phenylalanyl-tRNA--protein transferase